MIMASKCISKLTHLQPPSASLGDFISASNCISILTRRQTLSVSLSYPVSAVRCVSKLAQSWPPCSQDHGFQLHLLTCQITASKCISEFTRSLPACASLRSTCSPRPSACSKSLNPSLQVHLQVHKITASNSIDTFSQLGSPGAPLITVEYRLLPD